MSRRRWAALPLALLLSLTLATSAAQGASGSWTDPFGDVGVYTPDIGPVFADWGSDGTLLVSTGLNQTGMSSGDRVYVYLDVNLDRTLDFRIELGCCSTQTARGTFVSMAVWNGSVWLLTEPSTLVGGYVDGRALVAVNRSDVAFPNGRILFLVQSLNASVPGADVAPDGNLFYVLDEGTQVGGATGPGDPAPPTPSPVVEEPAPTPQTTEPVPVAPDPAAPAPDPSADTPTPTPAAPAPRLDRRKARVAVKDMVRRELGSARRITSLRCTRSGRFTCALRAAKGARRWRGTATVRVLPSGRHRASFSGVSTHSACRVCRRAVRW